MACTTRRPPAGNSDTRGPVGSSRYSPDMTSLRAGREPCLLEDLLALVEGSAGASGAIRALGHALAPVQTWLASPEQGITADIKSVNGAQATIDALTRLAPSGLTVVGAVASADACWAEIERRGEGEPETCIAGLTYGPTGQPGRVIWLRAPLVARRAAGAAGAAFDGRA